MPNDFPRWPPAVNAALILSLVTTALLGVLLVNWLLFFHPALAVAGLFTLVVVLPVSVLFSAVTLIIGLVRHAGVAPLGVLLIATSLNLPFAYAAFSTAMREFERTQFTLVNASNRPINQIRVLAGGGELNIATLHPGESWTVGPWSDVPEGPVVVYSQAPEGDVRDALGDYTRFGGRTSWTFTNRDRWRVTEPPEVERHSRPWFSPPSRDGF